ncbi:hypothetical protein LDENG_00027400 [Lucifuga dentata]|nr:hypothetical protein LDENG_00027400 [Lucifuga dentata]
MLLSIIHLVLKHLEDPRAYARMLFIDFNSAFNTIQPFILIQKLKQLNVNSSIVKWYHSFLTNRTQRVKVNDSLSQLKTISTGAPQGCVSSPVLFTLYTNECSAKHSQNYIFKYSDDTAILSLLYKQEDISFYHSEIREFVAWCDSNHLTVNIKKTEEIVFDPKALGDHSSVIIHDQPIAQVQSYKYLGVYIDSTFTWNTRGLGLLLFTAENVLFTQTAFVWS